MTNSTNESSEVGDGEVLYPPWTKAPCEQCGIDGQASRVEARTTPYICEGCEMYARGEEEGIAYFQPKLDSAEALALENGRALCIARTQISEKDKQLFMLTTLVKALTANAKVEDRTKSLDLRLFGLSQMALQMLDELEKDGGSND